MNRILLILIGVLTLASCGNNASSTIEVTDIELSISTDIELNEGQNKTLVATVIPPDATDTVLEWFSSDNGIATVSDGFITAVHEGEALITVQAKNGISTSIKVIVSPKVPVTGIKLEPSTLTFVEGSILEKLINIVIEPEDATSPGVKWSSSDQNIATVSSGSVTINNKATAGQTATITATTVDGNFSAMCEIVITEKDPLAFPENAELYFYHPDFPVESAWGFIDDGENLFEIMTEEDFETKIKAVIFSVNTPPPSTSTIYKDVKWSFSHNIFTTSSSSDGTLRFTGYSPPTIVTDVTVTAGAPNGDKKTFTLTVHP